MSWTDSIAAFDLETTGVDVRQSRIVSACVARLDAAGEVVSRRDWLLDPGIEIPAAASAVHGITTARARAEGAAAREGVLEIALAVRAVFDAGVPLVVYNAPYDLTLLAYELRRHGHDGLGGPAPVVDPIVLDKQVDRYRRGKRTLDRTAAHYGVELVGAHDAGADAIAAARVALAIAARHGNKLPAEAAALHAAQVGWAAEQQADFAAYMRRTVDPAWVSDRAAWPGGAVDDDVPMVFGG